MDSKGMISMSVALVALVAAWTALSHAPAALAATGPTTITLFLHYDVPPLSADVLIPPKPLPINSLYGEVVVFDYSVTAPSPTSLEVGRARGFYVAVAKDNLGAGLEFMFTVQFNAASGNFNGSTLSFMGFERTTDPVGYLSIVGGTGVFVKASGQAAVVFYSVIGSAGVLDITATFTYGF